MLTELRIENFAIIQRLELELKPGLITFTGETGAGKSIILDAITAVVGGKTDGSFIRAGADRANVEATFRLSDTNREIINEILEREELLDDPNYLTLSAANYAAKAAVLRALTGALRESTWFVNWVPI